MWPDRVLNPGPLTYESGALPTALHGPEVLKEKYHYSFRFFPFKSRPLTKGSRHQGGWSGGAMVLGKLPVPGRPTLWIKVGQGPTALVVGAGGGCSDIFTLTYPFLFSFSLSLGDGPIWTEILSQRAVKPKKNNQPTNIVIKGGN